MRLKIDIEGCDMLCLDALRGIENRPRFLSLESVATSPGCSIRDVHAALRTQHERGYRRFKYVDRARIPGSKRQLWVEGATTLYEFAMDSSGPFGEETPGYWPAFAGIRCCQAHR